MLLINLEDWSREQSLKNSCDSVALTLIILNHVLALFYIDIELAMLTITIGLVELNNSTYSYLLQKEFVMRNDK